MAEHRPFPPSARRRALARQAGLSAGSPLLVAAAAGAAALVAISATGGALVHRLGSAIAAACQDRAVLPSGAASDAVLAIALPLAGAAAVAAVVVHLAQTRAVWLPRRRIAGAPAFEGGPLPRSRRAAFDLAAAALLGGAAFAWLWLNAPRLAATVGISSHDGARDAPVAAAHDAFAAAALSLRPLGDTAALLANLVAVLVLAWAVLGVLDALVRHAALARALAMTPAEKRDDDRLAGADPRWRARRAAVQRELTPADAVAGASLVLLGDDAAIAIAWDPVRRPVPLRTATGRGPRATQLLGLARRHRVPVHRDPALAAALVSSDAPIPERHWPRLAEIVAATRGRAI
jgi:flagellar biosynthesis protein FlhB